jgi:hypothetical protein
VLWLDAYHFDNPKAPLGLKCVAFRLGPPPVDPFLATDLRVALALAQSAQAPAAAIPLIDAAGTVRGLAFDRSRRLAIEAASAAGSGRALDAEVLMRQLSRLGLLVVAHPVACGNVSIAPVGIEVVPPQGPAPRTLGEAVTGDALTALLGGSTPQPGSIGVSVGLDTFRPTDRVRFTFAQPDCNGLPTTILLPVRYAPQRPVSLPRPPLPAGVSAPVDPVWLQAVIDLDGSFKQVTYIGGPESLLAAAMEAVKTWKAEPARVNGAPVVGDTLLLVQFQAQ